MHSSISKFFEKWHLDSWLYNELSKARRKFDKKHTDLSARFKKEIANIEKKLNKKLDHKDQRRIWIKKGYGKLLNDIRLGANASMKVVKLQHKKALAKINSFLK